MPDFYVDPYAVPFIIVATADILALQLGMTEYKKPWIAALEIILSLGVVGLNIYIILTAGILGLSVLGSASLFLLLALKGVIFMKYRDGRFVFSLTLISLMILLSVSVSLVWMRSVERGGNMFTISLGVLCILTILLTQALVRKPYCAVQENLDRGWVVYSLVPIAGNGLVLVCLMFCQSAPIYLMASLIGITFLLCAISIATFFYFFYQLRESLRLETDIQLLRSQQKAQEELEQVRQKNELKERRLRHDQRHMYQVLIDELDGGDVEGVKQKLVRMRGDDLVPDVTYCKNPTVNSVLKVWSYRAQEKGIDMEIRADVPADLAIDSMELGSLFSNLIENAYEGCLRLERQERKRFIKFSTSYRKGKLMCQVQNSARTDIEFDDEGMPASQKHAGEGIGTRSARSAVLSHGGTIKYSLDNGVFTARFIVEA